MWKTVVCGEVGAFIPTGSLFAEKAKDPSRTSAAREGSWFLEQLVLVLQGSTRYQKPCNGGRKAL